MGLIHLVAALVFYSVFIAAAELKNNRGFKYHQYSLKSLPIPLPRLEDLGVEELHTFFENGSLTSVNLVHASLPSSLFQVQEFN